jgi:4-oxalomesaconate tautomerase
MQTGLRCMLMRGGTSKGAYFLAGDLPADPTQRDQILLAALGSPDPRQIDGVGDAHPLTSKVAIVSRSTEPGIDVDFLFAQVAVNKPMISWLERRKRPSRILVGGVKNGAVSGDPNTLVLFRPRLVGGRRIIPPATMSNGASRSAGDRSARKFPGRHGEISPH